MSKTYVLTCYDPESYDTEVLYVSDNKEKLEALIKEFYDQIRDLSFKECPEVITFGEHSLKKDDMIVDMYYSFPLRMKIAYAGELEVREVNII